MPRLFAALLLFAIFTGANADARSGAAAHDVAQSGGNQPKQQTLTSAFFVGTWTTRNIEFGRDVEIEWTLWRDGTLAYRFAVDGLAFDGSTGTWHYDGALMHEQWNRPDGSIGSGRGSVELIDDDTIRLTIVDNGDPTYAGMSRVYRRKGPAQLSWLPK